MDTGHGPQEHQEDYSFMQETFKDEQLSPKKIIVKTCKWLALGVLFGAAACISFFALKPWAEETFQEEPDQVEIQQNDDDLEQDEVDNTDDFNPPELPQTQEREDLSLKDYFDLSNELMKVAQGAQSSIVQVTGLVENADWSSGANSILGTTAGIIVADNDRELLILANYASLKDTNMFNVEFVDGSVHPATLKQKDKNLDMAVYCVSKEDITAETEEQISIAKIGNSSRILQGNTMIAIGQPFGVKAGLGYGIASSLNEKATLADGEYDLIVTDMIYDEYGNGFLIDINGFVVGCITTNGVKDSDVMVAYGISDITNVIEMMSNGKQIPYAGIIGTIVTEETSELYGIPKGLFVTDVEVDSPAMKAGIQNGDVITKIGSVDIESLDIYHDALYGLEPGRMVKFMGQRYGTAEYVAIDFAVTIGIKE